MEKKQGIFKMEGKKPETKFRAGAITATVWKNEFKNKENKVVEFFSIDIVRNYTTKDDKGEDVWNKTSSFSTKDLSDVELVTRKAHEYVRLKEIQDN